MKLFFDDIVKITVGSVETWQEGDEIHFSKCTKKQLEVWNRVEPDIINNAKATTGVRFDFCTNSSFVRVAAKQNQKHEIKVDGVLEKQIIVDESGEFEIQLGKTGVFRRVVITLPNHFCQGVVRYIEVEDGCEIKRSSFDCKALFLGDSITQGHAGKFDSNCFAYLVSDSLNAESVIQGIGGSRFEPETVMDIGFSPDMVFVAYGTNDFNVLPSLNKLKSACFEYLSRVKQLYSRSQIYVISPVWRADENQKRQMGSFADCCESIKKIAKNLGLNLIDGEKMLNKNMDFMHDAIHPNDLGFGVYAHNLLREINNLKKA